MLLYQLSYIDRLYDDIHIRDSGDKHKILQHIQPVVKHPENV